MIKRLLLLWLITCTLGYGSVWAFDGHFDEAAEHRGDVGRAADERGDRPSCDHCCHVSAHVTGLLSPQAGPLYPSANADRYGPYQRSVSFHTTSPPERPPQA